MEDIFIRNAIILAAGFGMRMVPINYTMPKGLLQINGETLVERIIKQLHIAGIKDITVVVGFLYERFDYLIDDYGVELIYNEKYSTKNNLHSLALVSDRIHNTFIIPCDIWCKYNPFIIQETNSWYMVSKNNDMDSSFCIQNDVEIVKCSMKENCNRLIGISFISESDASLIIPKLKVLDDDQHSNCFWEEVLVADNRMIIPAKIVKDSEVKEINTYEQLREVDTNSNQLKSDAIDTIISVLKCNLSDIYDIKTLKKGMTNRSFVFSVKNEKYIMRIPGEGTDKLINRENEAAVFATISGLGLCDNPVYINPKNGYKITKYLEGIRACDPENVDDLKKCMTKLKKFHEMRLQVPHSFDIFRQIEFYEELWEGTPSVFRDYQETKSKVFSLKNYIDGLKKDCCLTHIDAVPDNFLFYQTENGEDLQLTDWEYSGLQDPHVDIAMFCIYSLYDKSECDRLIDIYFENKCDKTTRAKIYCYIAMCGLLWSNWCEYKRKLGVEFGEYSLRQYRYAKDFYRFATELIGEN